MTNAYDVGKYFCSFFHTSCQFRRQLISRKAVVNTPPLTLVSAIIPIEGPTIIGLLSVITEEVKLQETHADFCRNKRIWSTTAASIQLRQSMSGLVLTCSDAQNLL